MVITKNTIASIFFVIAAVCFGLVLFGISLGKLSLDTAGLLFTAVGLAIWSWKG